MTLLGDLARLLTVPTTLQRLEILMTTANDELANVNTKLDTLTGEVARIAGLQVEDVQALRDEIQTLQAAAAADEAADLAGLTAVADRLDANISALQAVGAPADPPADPAA